MTVEPTGRTRHRMALVKEGFFSRKKLVFILQKEYRHIGEYIDFDTSNGGYGREVDYCTWQDVDSMEHY